MSDTRRAPRPAHRRCRRAGAGAPARRGVHGGAALAPRLRRRGDIGCRRDDTGRRVEEARRGPVAPRRPASDEPLRRRRCRGRAPARPHPCRRPRHAEHGASAGDGRRPAHSRDRRRPRQGAHHERSHRLRRALHGHRLSAGVGHIRGDVGRRPFGRRPSACRLGARPSHVPGTGREPREDASQLHACPVHEPAEGAARDDGRADAQRVAHDQRRPHLDPCVLLGRSVDAADGACEVLLPGLEPRPRRHLRERRGRETLGPVHAAPVRALRQRRRRR